MIPSVFTYKKAGSVSEALQLKAENEDSKFLAGGHSLIPTMKLRLSSPSVLIDISKIDTLRSITEEGNQIVIGSLVTHAEIVNSDVIKTKVAIMSEGASMIGDVQVRNCGTIGGSIAHADPAADWPAILKTVEATVVIEGESGKREVNVEDFFQGVFTTDLTEDEIITAIKVPVPASGTKGTYQKFMQPASRFAIVGCAAMLTISNGVCQKARVTIGGAASTSFRDLGVEKALEGKELNAQNIENASKIAGNGVQMTSSHFATNSYRQHLTKVYTQRALESLI
ncbi:MAG: xanthine dehydrogenase family protein subunit M [Cyclobacteriaceae bacterium]|nr:xanthine dehydrogenase family protein subunit M [Cyclobacteriaceae bacterium]